MSVAGSEESDPLGSAEGQVERRSSGRPRGPSSATQYAVLSAAWRILADEGITALTPTRLHAETGVARTTIYRHWPDAEAVVADIVAGASHGRAPRSASGDLRSDLLAALGTLTFRLRHRPVGPLLGALLVGQTRRNSTSPTSAQYVAALVEPIRDVLVESQSSGALRGSVDPDALLGAFVGPLLLDVVLLGADPESVDDAAIVDDFLERYQASAATPVVPMRQPDAEPASAVTEPMPGPGSGRGTRRLAPRSRRRRLSG